MYVKKQDREIIGYITEFCNANSYPKGFNEWIDSLKINLGFKQRGTCKCSMCEKSYTTNKKINEYDICPYCNSKLLLKRFNIQYYDNKQYLNLIQPYEDRFGKAYLIRAFELRSEKPYNMQKNNHYLTEYAWQIIYLSGELGITAKINTMRRNTSGYWYISYWEEVSKWVRTDSLDVFYGKFYSDNIDDVLKPKYFSLKPLLSNTDEINICEVIDAVNTNNYVFEMLNKAKLYNLAARYDEFKKGKFNEVFGIDKSYLKFMQDNNITYDELDILKQIKIADIGLIRYLDSFGYRLDELLKYCKPTDLYKYKLNPINTFEYLDYLGFCKKLKYDLRDKKILYPSKLKEKHDQLQNLITINENKSNDRKINAKYKSLKRNIYQNKKFIIFPTKSVEEMIDESSQQNNCVKTYVERVVNNKCDIYFMRLLEDQSKSLVTVEVRDNKVVQQRTKNNMDTTPEQKRFLKKWEREVLQCQ